MPNIFGQGCTYIFSHLHLWK